MKTLNAARKGFRLFKRGDDGREMDPSIAGYKERHYYFRFTFRGKAYPRCLETNDATEAQRRAKAKYAEIVAAVSSGEYKRLDATKLRSADSVSLSDLITAYRIGPSEAAAKTRQCNINALLQIAAGAALVRELTPALARKYFDGITAKALAQPDQGAAASMKRTANSVWQAAASLFTPRCLAHYQDKGLITNPAALLEFCAAGKAARFDKKKLKIIYRPPAESIITKTLQAWIQLAQPDATKLHRDMFLVIGHELAYGLRKGEMVQARWNWHQTRQGYPVLDGTANVKNGSGLVQVRALDPWFTTMKDLATACNWWLPSLSAGGEGQGEVDSPIVAGTATYQREDIYNAISAWLRDLGWETQKTNHALRAYAGSQVAMKYGIWEASAWLRHSSVEVTQSHYMYFLKTFPVADKELIAAKWAVSTTVPAKVTSAAKDVTLDVSSDFRQTPPDSAKVMAWTPEKRN